jgi:hypothetical protein
MTAADDTPQWRAQQTSPLAIASMVCGMVALVLGPLAILAIVFGHIARGQVHRTGEGGRGMATTGLILGYLVLVAGIALTAAFLASLPSQRQSKPSPLGQPEPEPTLAPAGGLSGRRSHRRRCAGSRR